MLGLVNFVLVHFEMCSDFSLHKLHISPSKCQSSHSLSFARANPEAHDSSVEQTKPQVYLNVMGTMMVESSRV